MQGPGGSVKYVTKSCKVDGCTNQSKKNGLCVRHGAKPKCMTEGCMTNAQDVKSGLCYKHGGGVRKVMFDGPGCRSSSTSTRLPTNPAVPRHKSPCRIGGCSTNVKARGLCVKHGAYGPCVAIGCISFAQLRGVCAKHGGARKRNICSREGCSTNANTRGLCWKHGQKRTCTIEGCPTVAHARGFCRKHGGGAAAPSLPQVEQLPVPAPPQGIPAPPPHHNRGRPCNGGEPDLLGSGAGDPRTDAPPGPAAASRLPITAIITDARVPLR